jgi:hypothetical protein
MKIRYLGTSAVDVYGHDGVEHGQVIDVPADVAHSLLLAGSSISEPDEHGEVKITPPDSPLWEKHESKPPKAAPPAAPAETEEV